MATKNGNRLKLVRLYMRRIRFEILEDRRLLAVDLELDVNGDGYVSPIDALLVIEAINSVDANPVTEIPADSDHLFILSGQSNMKSMALEQFSTHTDQWAVEHDVNVDYIKVNEGGAGIAEWYDIDTDSPTDHLNTILSQILSTAYESVTLLWMQGETDARLKTPISEYDEAFNGILDVVSEATNIEVAKVDGRLSDFTGPEFDGEAWNALREYKMNGRWVDTDDLNDFPDSPNELHYTDEGYRILGERFAEKAINIIAEENTFTPESMLMDDYAPIDSYFANSPDLTGDGLVTPHDALLIINELNK